MTDYIHDAALVADSASFQRAPNASITVYDAEDATNAVPLVLKDLNGLPLANPLTSSQDAFTPAFITSSAQVKLVGGGLTVVLNSFQGLREDALAAQAEAQAAKAAAQGAQAAAETAGADAAEAAAEALASAVADAEAAKAAAQAAADLVGAPADTAISTAINAPGSATRTALDATILTQIDLAAADPKGSIHKGLAAFAYQMFDGYQGISGPGITGSGDSLSAGAGGAGTSWCSALQSTLAHAYSKPGTVTNLGVGGETSSTIAGRTGLGVPWVATVAGGSIPATGGVAITLQSEDGSAVAPLLQGSAGVNPVIIAGVEGTLTKPAADYIFTRSASGAAVAVEEPAVVSTAAQRMRQGDIFVMWWGQNDGTTDATNIIARQKATIARLQSFQKRYLVLGLSTGSDSSRAAMDAQFLEAHGIRFLNIRKYLSSTAALAAEGITPTAADTADIAAGRTPTSFQTNPPVDTVHLNAAGYRRVGRAVYEKIKALGWNDQWGTLGDDSDVHIPQILFEDNFALRADGSILGTQTPIGGKSWFASGPGTATITGGRLALSPTGGEMFALVNGGSNDGVVKAKLADVTTRAKLVLRYHNTTSYLFLDATVAAPYYYRLRSNVGGTVTDVSVSTTPMADGDDIEVTVSGTVVNVKVNGTAVLTNVTVPTMAGTNYGFLAYPTTTSQRWASIRMQELP